MYSSVKSVIYILPSHNYSLTWNFSFQAVLIWYKFLCKFIRLAIATSWKVYELHTFKSNITNSERNIYKFVIVSSFFHFYFA